MNKFDQIATRYAKPRYKGLNTDQKRMIKLSEEQAMLIKSVTNTYRFGKINYGDNFRKDERFLDDFDLIFKWDQRILKINSLIEKLEEKTKQSLADVSHLRNELNQTPGGSF